MEKCIFKLKKSVFQRKKVYFEEFYQKDPSKQRKLFRNAEVKSVFCVFRIKSILIHQMMYQKMQDPD